MHTHLDQDLETHQDALLTGKDLLQEMLPDLTSSLTTFHCMDLNFCTSAANPDSAGPDGCPDVSGFPFILANHC